MARARAPEITLTIDIERLNQVLMILGKQPFEQVADLIVDLRNQAQMQLAPQGEMMPISPPPRPNGEMPQSPEAP